MKDIAKLVLRVIILLLQVLGLLVQTTDVVREFFLLCFEVGLHLGAGDHQEHLPYTFIEVDPRVHLVYFVHSQLQDPPLPLLARGLLLRDSQCAGRLDGGMNLLSS